MTEKEDVVVEATGLGRRFGERDALDGVDLSIRRGSVFGIFGANGSGKTTFLKILATLLLPGSGRITVEGHSLPREAEAVRRRIGVLFDQPLVPPDFSLEEGLLFTARLRGLRDPGARIDALLERVGLVWRRRDPLRTFSRGMLQRASLVAALLAEPALLLLDEPFTGLDPSGCALLEEMIDEQRAGGRTVVLVTHDLVRGERLADEMAVFDRGRLVRQARRGEWSASDLLNPAGAKAKGP